jgi:hypothetical protein
MYCKDDIDVDNFEMSVESNKNVRSVVLKKIIVVINCILARFVMTRINITCK